jgi:hypothetical protein
MWTPSSAARTGGGSAAARSTSADVGTCAAHRQWRRPANPQARPAYDPCQLTGPCGRVLRKANERTGRLVLAEVDGPLVSQAATPRSSGHGGVWMHPRHLLGAHAAPLPGPGIDRSRQGSGTTACDARLLVKASELVVRDAFRWSTNTIYVAWTAARTCAMASGIPSTGRSMAPREVRKSSRQPVTGSPAAASTARAYAASWGR